MPRDVSLSDSRCKFSQSRDTQFGQTWKYFNNIFLVWYFLADTFLCQKQRKSNTYKQLLYRKGGFIIPKRRLKNIVPKTRLKIIIPKTEVENYCTKKDVQKIIVPKTEVKNCCTKKEVKNCCTKKEVENFCTEKEVEIFCTEKEVVLDCWKNYSVRNFLYLQLLVATDWMPSWVDESFELVSANGCCKY